MMDSRGGWGVMMVVSKVGIMFIRVGAMWITKINNGNKNNDKNMRRN